MDSRQEGQLNFRVEDLAEIFNSFRYSIVTTLSAILFHSETKVSFRPHKITDIHPWDISWGLKKPPFPDPVGVHILILNHHCLFWRTLAAGDKRITIHLGKWRRFGLDQCLCVVHRYGSCCPGTSLGRFLLWIFLKCIVLFTNKEFCNLKIAMYHIYTLHFSTKSELWSKNPTG